jgi:arylsulfatase K
MYCGINLPHPPFAVKQTWLDKIDRSEMVIPPREEANHPVMKYARISKLSDGYYSDDAILDIRQIYYAMIAEADEMVGEILQAIHELGMTEDTYVIYTSDHGEMNMEHGQWYKSSMYEASSRVPLIISGPGVRKGVVVEDLVSLVDIYPTLMDMASITTVRDNLNGHSLMPELQGNKSDRPNWVFAEYHSNSQNTGSFMIRKGVWKYVAYVGYNPQLFHLESDPDEINNLYLKRPDQVVELDHILRSVVDYETVDKKVKEYDKQAFLQWKQSLNEAEYVDTMTKLYGNWTKENHDLVEAWTNLN